MANKTIEEFHYFKIDKRYIPKKLGVREKPYEIILEKQVIFTCGIGSKVELWTTNGDFAQDNLGMAIIDEVSHIPGNKPNETYTRIKFRMASIKENDLGRKIQA